MMGKIMVKLKGLIGQFYGLIGGKIFPKWPVYSRLMQKRI